MFFIFSDLAADATRRQGFGWYGGPKKVNLFGNDLHKQTMKSGEAVCFFRSSAADSDGIVDLWNKW